MAIVDEGESDGGTRNCTSCTCIYICTCTYMYIYMYTVLTLCGTCATWRMLHKDPPQGSPPPLCVSGCQCHCYASHAGSGTCGMWNVSEHVCGWRGWGYRCTYMYIFCIYSVQCTLYTHAHCTQVLARENDKQ